MTVKLLLDTKGKMRWLQIIRSSEEWWHTGLGTTKDTGDRLKWLRETEARANEARMEQDLGEDCYGWNK